MANKDNHPLTPRAKRLRFSIWGALLVGFLIGILSNLFENGGGASRIDEMTGQALNPTAAIIIAIFATVASVLLTILYHKNADEHEERAVLWGSTIGAYTATITTFVWLILHKGQLMPEPNVVALIGILAFASLAVYAWIKYR